MIQGAGTRRQVVNGTSWTLSESESPILPTVALKGKEVVPKVETKMLLWQAMSIGKHTSKAQCIL